MCAVDVGLPSLQVHGIIRRSSSFNTGRIVHLYKDPRVKIGGSECCMDVHNCWPSAMCTKTTFPVCCNVKGVVLPFGRVSASGVPHRHVPCNGMLALGMLHMCSAAVWCHRYHIIVWVQCVMYFRASSCSFHTCTTFIGELLPVRLTLHGVLMCDYSGSYSATDCHNNPTDKQQNERVVYLQMEQCVMPSCTYFEQRVTLCLFVPSSCFPLQLPLSLPSPPSCPDLQLHYGDLTDSSCLVKLISEV